MKINKDLLNKIKNKIYYFIPLISGVLLYILLSIINSILFKLNLLSSIYIIPDVLFSILISYIIFLFSKRLSIFLIIQSIFYSLIYIGDSIKTSFFGAPIIMDDLFLIKEATISLWFSNPIFVILPVFFIVGLILLLVLNIQFRKSGAILLLIMTIFVFSLNIFHSQYYYLLNKLDKRYLFWNQQENFKHNGPFIYFIGQYIRSYNKNNIPTKDQVENALENLNKDKIIASINQDPSQFKEKSKFDLYKNRPNIYFILVESLWDPLILNNTKFSSDPLYKDFRDLINTAKDNFSLSPTFEGKTADPEFELLCGIPILQNNIVFQTDLKNNLECLPRVLSELGYKTNVYHPDFANFYNRSNVYRKIGFSNYFSLNDYEMNDLNYGKLSDSSFLSQSYKIGESIKTINKPQFNYYLTLSTHIPYIMNENRQSFITNNINNEWINNYSNAIYYTTKEISEFVNKIKTEDPNSIIIITGDHLPFLGMNQEVYKITKTTDLITLHSTPLIIINKEETENVGNINMYELPNKILELIGVNSHNLTLGFFTLNGLRPLYVDKTTPEYISKNKEINIEKEKQKLQYYKTIYNDLLFGKQYSIRP